VLHLLREIRTRAQFLDGDREAGFSAEQNALIAVNAEKYYTAMMGFDNESWNVRDRHMMETLDRLLRFHDGDGKAIVWEHNTHIGDARATDMMQAGMVNMGQLAREKYGGENVYLVGFGSYRGTVIAGEEWGAPMREMSVPPAKEGSIEQALFHQGGANRYYLMSAADDAAALGGTMPHRAIGVVYNPERERFGNYVPSQMTSRYDAFIYLEQTRALHPLHVTAQTKKIPETYPFSY
jgi:erythromycin esterase-like protein